MRTKDSKFKTSSWADVLQCFICWGFHLCTCKSPSPISPKPFKLQPDTPALCQPPVNKNSASPIHGWAGAQESHKVSHSWNQDRPQGMWDPLFPLMWFCCFQEIVMYTLINVYIKLIACILIMHWCN